MILVVIDSQIVYSDLARSDSGCKKEKNVREFFDFFLENQLTICNRYRGALDG